MISHSDMGSYSSSENCAVFLMCISAVPPLHIHRAAVVLLPIFEHCLRRLFVCTNTLPCRMLCAVSRGYFTTLDTFLEENIDADSAVSRPNLLVSELGNPFFQLLFDLFVHPAGKRVRDRLSHGEADVQTVPLLFLDRLIGAIVALCHRYHPSFGAVGFDKTVSPQVLRCAEFCFSDYIGCFHPQSLLQKALGAASQTVAKLEAAIARFPPRPTSSEDENPDVHYRRVDFPEATSSLRAALATLEGEDPPVLLSRRTSPFTTPGELVSFTGMTSLVKSYFGSCEMFFVKIESFLALAESPKAPVRQKAAFSKFLGAMETIQLALICAAKILVSLAQGWRQSRPRYAQKLLNLANSSFERYERGFSENNWASSVQQAAEMVKYLLQLSTSNKSPGTSIS